jgi:hypothetical protein
MVLIAVVAAPVAARDTTGATAAAKSKASAEHARILKYWTKQRIANAQPRDFVRRPDGAFAKAHATAPTKGKPPGSGTNVTGASWTGGGLVLRASGKVLFTLDSGDYICTGAVVNDGTDNGRSIVLSAGHCAYDEEDGGFARNWMFYPEFDASPSYTCSQSKWGCWTASTLAVHRGFAEAGGFNTQATTYDWSFAKVPSGGKTNTELDKTVGSFAIAFSPMAAGTQTYNFGYPAAGKYHGKDLVYCSDQVFLDPLNQNLTLGVDCDMTGGSSGGPWLIGFTPSTGVGTLNSVNSYGYSGVKKEYGPRFNTANTQPTYTAAVNQSNGNVLVGTAP